MPILRIVTRPTSRETYDAVMTKMDLDRRHPLGLVMHGATEVDGGIQIAQVWESEEYARSFEEDNLALTLRALEVPADGEVTILELHHLVTP
jgi:hypothetical protein